MFYLARLVRWVGLLGMVFLAGSVSVAEEENEDDEIPVESVVVEAEEPGAGENKATDFEFPRQALVLISSREGGRGSGFIAAMRGRTFLISNAHVLGMGEDLYIVNLEGQEVVFAENVFVSGRRDLVLAPIEWDDSSLEVAESLSALPATIGDEVIVLGNEQGAGVATRLTGKITGIGPDRIEVDAEFVPGNSGSPVIHVESGKVIGIASYIQIFDEKAVIGQAEERIRRFAYRIDSEKNWRQVRHYELVKEYGILSEFEETTRILAELSYMFANHRTIITGYRSHPEIGHLLRPFSRDFRWARGTQSPNNRRLLNEFKNGLSRSIDMGQSEAENNIWIGFFRERLQDLIAVREQIRQMLHHIEY